MSSIPVSVPREPGGARRWLDHELARLATERPGIDRLLRATWRRPVPFVVVLSVLMEGFLGAAIVDGDADWFRHAGVAMIGPGFLDVFSDSGLQIGPIYLAGIGLAARLFAALGLPVVFMLSATQAAGVAWLATWTAGRAARITGTAQLPAQWAVGLTLALGGFLAEGVGNGHPEEILLGLLLANAALSAGRGRFAVAGVLIGLATGIKQWGIIGAGVLLTGRRLRGVVVGSATLAAVVLSVYLPFALGGQVKTLDMAWGIPRGSMLGLIGGWVHGSDWTLRAIQGALAGAVGAAVSLRRRGSPLVAVALAISARLFLDPLRLSYYSGPLVAVVLLWLWTSDDRVLRRLRLPVTAAMPLLVLGPYVSPAWFFWPAGNVVLVVAPVALLVLDGMAARRRTAEPVGGATGERIATNLPPCPTPSVPSPVPASS
ncbi:glycosyltransferase family 87 protein [Cellulomonas sp. McL0617]|uniref:glycosyltransferase family 87 protein n=1 Tax=Cellulomonas sp. McL0617 TaxID=3415675 RepID=UPI003CF0A2E4